MGYGNRGNILHVDLNNAVTKGIIVLATLILFMTGAKDLHAYTYTYYNKTGYLLRVIVEIYNGEDRTNLIESNGSYSISTGLLLKSWNAEAFLDNQWQQILHLTCDFLPGDHSFSIHVDESRDLSEIPSRHWYSTSH